MQNGSKYVPPHLRNQGGGSTSGNASAAAPPEQSAGYGSRRSNFSDRNVDNSRDNRGDRGGYDRGNRGDQGGYDRGNRGDQGGFDRGNRGNAPPATNR